VKGKEDDLQFEEVVRAYGEELLRLAYTYLKDRTLAEDVVQEVFIKAFEKRNDFRGDASYKTYLYRITINKCHDYFRSWSYKNTQVSSFIQQVFKSNHSVEEIAQTRNDELILGKAVLQLSIKYREIIVLYYYKDFSIEEIAKLLDCSGNTVKTRLRRGRQLLKNHLMEQGGDLHERFSI